MHATIRSYHGVDRTAELTTKVNQTLVPKLSELPGFAGYYLVDAGNGIFTSFGLFETREQGEESTKLVTRWIRDEKLDTLMPNEPKITSGKVVARIEHALVMFAPTAPGPGGRPSRVLSGRPNLLRSRLVALCHLVTAPSHRSCDLLLKATRGVTIAVVSSRERKRRQPGLATDDPAFVGWHQLVRGIQGSQVHFDFVGAACENGRAAAGTENRPA